MRPATPLTDLTERQWQAQLVQLATTLGWRHFHDLNARGSDPGWPDLTLARDRLVFLELKSEKGKLTVAQAEWLRALLVARAEVYVARPRDLEVLGAILAHRGRDPFVGPVVDLVESADLHEATRVEVDRVLEKAAA